jgi:hypothetical protein
VSPVSKKLKQELELFAERCSATTRANRQRSASVRQPELTT